MPVSGIPLALEKALDALFEANHLTSWNIRGGNFTTVTLRFRDQDGCLDQKSYSTPRSYRSKPPSAVKRDTIRRQDWFSKQMSKNLHSYNCENNYDKIQNGDAARTNKQVIDLQKSDLHKGLQGTFNFMQECEIEHDSSELSMKSDTILDSCKSYSTTPHSHSKDRSLKSHVTSIHEKSSMVQATKNDSCKNVKFSSHTDNSKQLANEDFDNWETIYYKAGQFMCDQCLRKIEDNELMKECTCIEKRRICWLCVYSHGEPYCHECKGSDVGDWISETGESAEDYGTNDEDNIEHPQR